MEDLELIIKKKNYRVYQEDKLVETTLHLTADGDQKDGSDLIYVQLSTDYKGLNLESTATTWTMEEVKKMVKFLNKAIEQYEAWDWENGCPNVLDKNTVSDL